MKKEREGEGRGERYAPPLWTAGPFVGLLLAIAVLPLVKGTKRFWHRNRNKLIVGLALAGPVLAYYGWGHPAMTAAGGRIEAGWGVLGHVLAGAVLAEYVPFMTLLAALYVISGGIRLRGDLPAHPGTNTAFLAVGGLLASLIGTTGAAMLLIRPLLATNSERKHVKHTVIFFIFIVCNVGGCLLPIGDPPLFLGYLRGVPFLWTLKLAGPWAFCMAVLLGVYYVWDRIAWRNERPGDVARDERAVERLGVNGTINFVYLAGVVLAAGRIVPGKPMAWLGLAAAPEFLREAVMLALAALSLATTPRGLRKAAGFDFQAILEVAALFIGIFLTMQAPIEILDARGASLGLRAPWQFFWATGGLSSFLDNAPTYVVFFETANSMTHSPGPGVLELLSGHFIRADLLMAVSLGAVFMGANTYIGNGPNFMVKAIAEGRGVRMPGFFAYMAYSVLILIPLFVLVTLVFLR
ncbi:MAG: sodium:proton antiporter [Planctomycetota bacterium]|nr:sodium:proton antiporter [Planctomycetota bacterium]